MKSEDAEVFWEGIGPASRREYLNERYLRPENHDGKRWPEMSLTMRRNMSRLMNARQGRYPRKGSIKYGLKDAVVVPKQLYGKVVDTKIKAGDRVVFPGGRGVVTGLTNNYAKVDVDGENHVIHINALMQEHNLLYTPKSKLTTWDGMSMMERQEILHKLKAPMALAQREWDRMPDGFSEMIRKEYAFKMDGDWECEECGDTFAEQSEYEDHIRAHDTMKYHYHRVGRDRKQVTSPHMKAADPTAMHDMTPRQMPAGTTPNLGNNISGQPQKPNKRTTVTGKTIFCADCGKVFRSKARAAEHTELIGHTIWKEETSAPNIAAQFNDDFGEGEDEDIITTETEGYNNAVYGPEREPMKAISSGFVSNVRMAGYDVEEYDEEGNSGSINRGDTFVAEWLDNELNMIETDHHVSEIGRQHGMEVIEEIDKGMSANDYAALGVNTLFGRQIVSAKRPKPPKKAPAPKAPEEPDEPKDEAEASEISAEDVGAKPAQGKRDAA